MINNAIAQPVLKRRVIFTTPIGSIGLTTAAKDSALLSFCCRGAKDSVFKSHRPPRKKLGFYQCFGESDRDNCQKLSFNQLLSGGAEELSFSGSFSRPRKTWTLSMFGKATEIQCRRKLSFNQLFALHA